jgi:LacI family transcriptional regulator
MVTIKEIAALTGVSPTTVSNVLHGRTGKMTETTLKRVRQAIEDRGYVANMSGRSLAKYGSKIIAIVKIAVRRGEFNIVYEPFFSEIIGELESHVRRKGYFLMLHVSDDVDECLRMAASWNVEGMIVHGGSADDCAALMRKARVPVVFIDDYFHDDGVPYVNIGVDDRQGGFMAAEYLIQEGHRRIAFLADRKKPAGDYYQRMAGCRAAMKKHALAFSAGDYIPVSGSFNERRETIRAMIQRVLPRYTALFFASDFLAADYVNLFRDAGVHVPGDISVCGFDDNIFALETRPRLTTIHQDVSLKAFYAVGHIVRMIRGEPPEQPRIKLPVSLVVRESTAKPNGG